LRTLNTERRTLEPSSNVLDGNQSTAQTSSSTVFGGLISRAMKERLFHQPISGDAVVNRG
jgi:hypothetical protein